MPSYYKPFVLVKYVATKNNRKLILSFVTGCGKIGYMYYVHNIMRIMIAVQGNR